MSTMIHIEESCPPGQHASYLPQSNCSSDEGLHTPTTMTDVNIEDAECSMLSNCRLKRSNSTPVLPYSSTPVGFRSVVNTDASVQIPIVGYEVMEERARFTVYKIKIENKEVGDSWFIFRRYTDFVRLNSKDMSGNNLVAFRYLKQILCLKSEFPKKVLSLPRKRWFGNNFSLSFIEERLRGLQCFIDLITNDKELLESRTIREFFCLDEPPSYSEIGEESRAIFEALEDNIFQLRKQLRIREAEIMNMRISMTNSQEKAVTIMETIKDATCEACRDKVLSLSDELQRTLCLQYSNGCS